MLLFIGIVILVKTLEYWSGLESRKKLNLTQLCFTHPIVPCPFSGLFLICELTAEAFFLLSYWKWCGPESSSFLSTCEFALLGGSQTILYKCVTNFGLLFVTLLPIETIKQFLSHKRTSKTDAVFLVPSSVSLIKGLIKAFCIAVTQPNCGKDLILVLVKWSPSKVGKSRLAPSPVWTWGSSSSAGHASCSVQIRLPDCFTLHPSIGEL